MAASNPALLTVEETGRRLGVSVSTVWRLIRRGEVRSIRRRGRRLVPVEAVAQRVRAAEDDIAPLSADHPLLRLAGAGRSGGRLPGARDKHGVLDR
jgi:excisionase family DNA binding protein